MAVVDGQPVNAAINNGANMSRLVDTSTVGKADFQNTTDSTTPDDGSVTVKGGMGVKKNLNVGGNQIVEGSTLIKGGLEVQGTTTTVNTTNTDVKDANITVNKGGTNLTAEGAGVDVERPGGNAGLRFDSALASGWKVGLLSALSEVITASFAQTLTGQKNFEHLVVTGVERLNYFEDSVTTGANALLGQVATPVLKVSHAGLTSIQMIDTNLGYLDQFFALVNDTGGPVIIRNEQGATAGKRILTGLNEDAVLLNGQTFLFYYDADSLRWRIFGATNTKIGAFGSTPNANGLSNVNGQLTLQPANATNPGALSTGAQDIPGAKTFKAAMLLESTLQGTLSVDNTITGANQAVPSTPTLIKKLTAGGLTSVNNIVGGLSGKLLVLTNATGGTVSLVNDSGGTAADRIITGTGSNMDVANGASVILYYDDVAARWRVVGGSSGGTPTFPNQSANTVFAGPVSGAAAAPGFRSLVTLDLSQATMNDISEGYGQFVTNGDFRHRLRGDSFSGIASGTTRHYNQWRTNITGTAVLSLALSALSPSSTDHNTATGKFFPFLNSPLYTTSTADASIAAGDIVIHSHTIEGYKVRSLYGNTFTVWGFMYIDINPGVYCISLRNSGNTRSYVFEVNVSATGVWIPYSHTVTGGLDTSGSWDFTTGVGINVGVAMACGSTFQTTPGAWQSGNFLATSSQKNGVATTSETLRHVGPFINLGTRALPFKPFGGSIETEFSAIERQFETITGSHLIPQTSYTTNETNYAILYRKQKRVTPTPILIGTANTNYVVANQVNGSSQSGFSFAFGSTDLNKTELTATKAAHGLTQTSFRLISSGRASALDIDAEF